MANVFYSVRPKLSTDIKTLAKLSTGASLCNLTDDVKTCPMMTSLYVSVNNVRFSLGFSNETINKEYWWDYPSGTTLYLEYENDYD